MTRPIAIVGAPSAIGIRPYDDGSVRRLDLAPARLRDEGIVARLGARDLGDVVPPPYRDITRPAGRPRNEDHVAAYSAELARRVAAASEDGAFVLVLGGDYSIVLGCLLGVRQPAGATVGLVYVDAHADFATPQESRTGSAASMCLALAVGRGDTPLARLDGRTPLVPAANVALIGRRDHADDKYYGENALATSALLDVPHDTVRTRGPADAARAALERVAPAATHGFWIHLDADVLDPAVVPAVDSPEPGGLGLDELVELVTPLARHPKALGLELTIYDPALDADGMSAVRLATLLERVLANGEARS